ncbi:thermophilic serine proteinase, partial [Enterococcus faecium]|nr:thermophilic serine proteinase [Enterococcus faecium]
MNWDVTMVPIRVFGSSGGTSLAILTEAINYASQKGFPIINFSIGSVVYSSTGSVAKWFGNTFLDKFYKVFFSLSIRSLRLP